MINIGKQELNDCIVNINNLGRGPKDRGKLTYRLGEFILEIPHKFWYMIVSKGCYTYVKTILNLF